MEPIAFTSKTEYKDYLKFAILRYSQYWPSWIVYCIGVCLILNSVFDDDISKKYATIIVLMSVLIMLIIPLRIYLKIKKAYSSNPFASEEINWTISELGIAFKQGSVSSKIGWDRITKISDSKEWIMLWYNKKPSLCFQKCFLTSDQINDFKKIIHQMRKGYLKY